VAAKEQNRNGQQTYGKHNTSRPQPQLEIITTSSKGNGNKNAGGSKAKGSSGTTASSGDKKFSKYAAPDKDPASSLGVLVNSDHATRRNTTGMIRIVDAVNIYLGALFLSQDSKDWEVVLDGYAEVIRFQRKGTSNVLSEKRGAKSSPILKKATDESVPMSQCQHVT
jgi:hypothetical protein